MSLRTLSKYAPPSLAGNATGIVYGVNGIDTPFVWDGMSGMRNWGIPAPPGAPTSAFIAGSLTGTYEYEVTWVNANTGNYGLFSLPLTVSPAAQGVQIIRPSISGIDPQVTHWRVWRTLNGSAAAFHQLTPDIAIATTTYNDNNADTAITSNPVLVEHSPPDPLFRFCQNYKNLLFLYGSRVESQGTVSITDSTAAVTGVGTQFNQSHVGQKFYFVGDAVVYTILSVTDATHLTLTTNKVGTVAGVLFRITAQKPSDMTVQRSDDESFQAAVRWGVHPYDGDFPTGIDQVGNALCLYKENHVYGYEFAANPDPATSAIVYPILTGRGLVNEFCAVQDGPFSYNLDRQGVYQFDGTAQSQPIDQAIRRYFRPDQSVPAEDVVNWAYAAKWHACLDPSTRVAMWFVTTGTDTVPKTALCYWIDKQAWTARRFPQGIRASCVEQDTNGVLRAWLTDNLAAPAGPWAIGDIRQQDGTATGTVAGTATATGANTLTDGTAAFTTAGAGLAGCTVAALESPFEIHTIVSNTATQLTIDVNWTNVPAVGTAYLVNAVETRWRTNWISMDQESRQQTQTITLFFEPTANDIVFYLRLFADFAPTPILGWKGLLQIDALEVPATARTDGWVKIHAAKGNGRCSFAMPQNAFRVFAVELMQLQANNPLVVEGFNLEIAPLGKSFRAE